MFELRKCSGSLAIWPPSPWLVDQQDVANHGYLPRTPSLPNASRSCWPPIRGTGSAWPPGRDRAPMIGMIVR